MTPEEVEARFQRIEALLAQAAEQNAERDRREEERDQREEERELREQDRDQREEDRDQREQDRDQREEDRDQRMDLMMIGINSLVESSIEYKQWKVETDQRFDILLQEIRATNQRVTILENNSSI